MLIPTVIIPNLPSCSEPRQLVGLSMQYVYRDSAGDQPASELAKFYESFVSTDLGGEVFHVAGSKDEGFYFRSKERVPEHKVQGNQVKLRVGKTAESSKQWWIPSPAELVRDLSKKTVPALLVSYQYIRTMDSLSGMLVWAGCLF